MRMQIHGSWTVRAVNVVVNGYEKSGGRNNESPYSEATADHIKIKQAFASQGYGKSQKLLTTQIW